MTADQLMECPFCGGISIGVREGSTFRWRVAFCNQCDATCSEIRHDTMADDQEAAERESHQRAIDEWNTRPTAVASHAEGEVVAGWVSQSSLDSIRRDKANVANLYGFKPSPRNHISDHIPLYTQPPRTTSNLNEPSGDSGELARDAARYRFLRDVPQLDLRVRCEVGSWIFGENLDQQIDAAMAETAEGGV